MRSQPALVLARETPNIIQNHAGDQISQFQPVSRVPNGGQFNASP
jgi:hypothetical protein